MPVDELVDPVTYSWWVTPLGLLLLAAAVAWVVWVLRTKRLDREPARAPAPAAPPKAAPKATSDRYAAIRPAYLERVDEVERRFKAGELDARGLHLALSTVVRDFATVRRGVDARSMTLAEIRDVGGTKRLAKLIESYYRPAFSRRGARATDVRRALEGARKVIAQW